jgi:hypothetical protein
MKMRTIYFAQEFTDTPGGRYRAHGEFSGEQFREEILKPALNQNDLVILNLNGAFGFPPSFIDEAFGILVEQLGEDVVKKKLRIELSDDPVAQRKIPETIKEHAAKKGK